MKNSIFGYVLPIFLFGVGLVMVQFESLSFIVGVVFIATAIIIFLWEVSQRKELLKNLFSNKSILRNIGNGKTDPQCALWDYGKYNCSCVPYSDTWKEWISSGNGKYGLVVTVNRPDLDYYNFGKEFCFVDLKTNKKISIPTGDKARKEKVGSSFYDGMVVRLMPKTS